MKPPSLLVKPSFSKPLWYDFDSRYGVWLSQQPDGWLWLLGSGDLAAATYATETKPLRYGADGINLSGKTLPLVGRLSDFKPPLEKSRRKHTGMVRPNVYYHNKGQQQLVYHNPHNQLLLKQRPHSWQMRFTIVTACPSIWKSASGGEDWRRDYSSWFAGTQILADRPGDQTLGLLYFLAQQRAELTQPFQKQMYRQLLDHFNSAHQSLKDGVTATNLQKYATQANHLGWWVAHGEAVLLLLYGCTLLEKRHYRAVLTYLRRRIKSGRPFLVNHHLAWFDNFLGNASLMTDPAIAMAPLWQSAQLLGLTGAELASLSRLMKVSGDSRAQPQSWPLQDWDEIASCFMTTKNVTM